MQYFAGLFDAEGCVSLCPNGAFIISVEMSNENIPSILQENFRGSIYKRQRENRKKTWIWKINSISSDCLFFIESVLPYSVIKSSQLQSLKEYLNIPRNDRRQIRSNTCAMIRSLKQPSFEFHDEIHKNIHPADESFFRWMAGFVDGDGNFVCNAYKDNRNKNTYFGHQISVSNIFTEAITYINDRIPGSIVKRNNVKNPFYTWCCKRCEERTLCENILPHLRIKSQQCRLFLEFIGFPPKQKKIPYDSSIMARMYEIINEIKHLNSL